MYCAKAYYIKNFYMIPKNGIPGLDQKKEFKYF